jgi:hypothetical protein
MYLPADSLGLTAQIATPISLPGGIAGPIVFGQTLETSGMVGLATGRHDLNLLNRQVQPTAPRRRLVLGGSWRSLTRWAP